MTIQELLATYILGDVPASELTRIVDKEPSNADLSLLSAILKKHAGDSQQVDQYFRQIVSDLGLEFPSQQGAAISFAKTIARSILEQQISAYEGARMFWQKIYVRNPEIARLSVFVGFASEYEDDSSHKAKYEEMICEECRLLLSEAD